MTKCDACATDHMVTFTRPSHFIFAYCKQSKARGQEGLRTGLCDNLVVTRYQSITKAVYMVALQMSFIYKNEVYFWGKCTMPLMNIQSDWMSNASYDLCIILCICTKVKEGSVTVRFICLLICMLISKHQIGHIKVTGRFVAFH